MVSYLSRILYRFQSAPMRKLALAALAAVVVAVLLGSFIRWLRRRRQDRPESWTGLLTGSVGDVLKVLAGLAVLAGICLHLRFSAEEFTRKRGGVSQRNYEAVKDIWGRPHRQRELGVELVWYSEHVYDKDSMEIDPAKLRATTQPIGFRKRKVKHVIPGEPVAAADHDIDLWMNYRRKGSAYYPCFETDFALNYRVVNFAGRDAEAVFTLPLPSQQGLIDRLAVTVDGKPTDSQVVLANDRLTWGLPMPAGAAHDVGVRYHSRGMDYLRFDPGAGRKLASYRIRMRCNGIAPEQVNYPIGCMTPTSSKADGDGTLLDWHLDNAVTRLGMGVIVPKKTQAGYYVGRVLSAAPWGLVLLLGMVLATHVATGRPVQWALLAALAVAFHLTYLLAGHLADYTAGLLTAIAIATAALTILTAVLQFARADRFAAASSVGFFLLFVAVYPLMSVADSAGLLMTILYVLLLGWVTALLVRSRPRDRTGPEPDATRRVSTVARPAGGSVGPTN